MRKIKVFICAILFLTFGHFLFAQSSDWAEPNDTPNNAYPLYIGFSDKGYVLSIYPVGDVDWFVLSLSGNVSYTIYTTQFTDTYGILYDMDGNILGQDDDSGPGFNFSFTITTSYAGAYYLQIQEFGNDNVGEYYLYIDYLGPASSGGTSSGGGSSGGGSSGGGYSYTSGGSSSSGGEDSSGGCSSIIAMKQHSSFFFLMLGLGIALLVRWLVLKAKRQDSPVETFKFLGGVTMRKIKVFICAILFLTFGHFLFAQKWWDKVKEKAQDLQQKATESWGKLKENAQDLQQKATESFREFQDSARESYRRYAEDAKEYAGKIKRAYKEYEPELRRVIREASPHVREFAIAVKDTVNDPEKLVDFYEKSNQIIQEAQIVAVKNIPIYDPETGRVMTFDSYMRNMVNEIGGLEGSDLGNDPVRTGMLLMLDSDYFYNKAKIIQTEDGRYVSIQEALTGGYGRSTLERANEIYQDYKATQIAYKNNDSSSVNRNLQIFTDKIKSFNSSSKKSLNSEGPYELIWVGTFGDKTYYKLRDPRTGEIITNCPSEESSPSFLSMLAKWVESNDYWLVAGTGLLILFGVILFFASFFGRTILRLLCFLFISAWILLEMHVSGICELPIDLGSEIISCFIISRVALLVVLLICSFIMLIPLTRRKVQKQQAT